VYRLPLIAVGTLAAALILPFDVRALQDSASQRAQAIILERDGRTDQAEQIWSALAKADPHDAEALGHLGLLEARREHYEAAIDYYRRAAALNPDLPGLQMNMGLAFFKAAQFPDAIRIFSSEIKKHPGDQRLTILLGMAHYGMKDYLVADPYLRRAIEQDPQNIPLRLTLAHSCLASKQYSCVIKVRDEIAAFNAESAEADMLAAQACDQLQDSSGAAKQLRAALVINPGEPNAHFGLGYLLWAQGKWAEAAAEFQLELQNDPRHALAQDYLADAQRQMRHAAATPSPPRPAALQDLIDSIENPAP
jgi:tetratricopeptide (TPR) repeat protein